MGEAKRRKKLDPTYGKVRRNNVGVDLDLFDKFVDLPASKYNEPENALLVEQGLEQVFLMAQQAGVEMPSMPKDPKQRQEILDKLRYAMANTRLELPDGSFADI